ncbi:MAG: DUF6796 family protein [Candidatus Cryptobacteroides sp.]
MFKERLIILVGDFLMGWGVRNASLYGLEGQVSQYLTVSDGRMFWSSLLGLIGVPIACLGHFGVYKLLKPYSRKYAKLYLIGILGFLAFGGAGVHLSSVESAFFYKYMAAADPNSALAISMKFASYFLLPLYIALLTCWIIMVYAQIKAVAKGFSPYPRWCWVFSMPVGTLLASLVSVFGNHAIVNAIMVGAFSLGNIWALSGALLMLGKAKDNVNLIKF